jgi:hypothetical protein
VETVDVVVVECRPDGSFEFGSVWRIARLRKADGILRPPDVPEAASSWNRVG